MITKCFFNFPWSAGEKELVNTETKDLRWETKSLYPVSDLGKEAKELLWLRADWPECNSASSLLNDPG